MATFKDCLVEARTALTSQTTITDVVAEGKITFGARPQEATQPAIVLEAQRSDYDATFDSYAKAITYRVAYLFFSQNAVQLAEMVDTIKDAVQLHTSSNFYIRIEDEGVTSDPDGNNIAYVITTWKDTQGTVANLVGSTGKTLGELAAQDADNTTDQTVAQLAAFYELQNSTPPQIAYPTFLHRDSWRVSDPGHTYPYGSNGYDQRLLAGDYTPGHAPANILHVAELDQADLQRKTLVNNNEFGNKHRFTWDDGTEATHMNATQPADIQAAAVAQGYTGDNWRYVIDHWTGLGWFLNSYSGSPSNGQDWYDFGGLYNTYADVQDFIDKPSTHTYAGYSDWRKPTMTEFLSSVGTEDPSIYQNSEVANADAGIGIYFPCINYRFRSANKRMIFAGPLDAKDDDQDLPDGPDWRFPWTQGTASLFTGFTLANLESELADGLDNRYVIVMCRRHYDNR